MVFFGKSREGEKDEDEDKEFSTHWNSFDSQGRYVIGIQKKKDEVCLPTKVIILPTIPRKAWDQFPRMRPFHKRN